MADSFPSSVAGLLDSIGSGSGSGGMPRDSIIPGTMVEDGLISKTSIAKDCFVNQQFSAKLQAFLIGYVGQVYSYYSVYK